MKIAFVIDSFHGPTAGTERQLFLLAKEMIAVGNDVELIVLRHTQYTSSDLDFPFSVVNLNLGSIASANGIRALWRLRKRIREKKFDVVHGFFNDTAIILPIVTAGLKTKVFSSRRDMGFSYSVKVLFILRCYRFSRCKIICNSDAVAKFAKRKEWIRNQNIAVIYNGLEPEEYAAESQIPDWYESDEQEETVKRVFMVANIRRIKRIEDLILAARVICRDWPSIKFYIVGEVLDDAYMSELVALADKCAVANKFVFAGKVSRPEQYSHLFDVAVSTSESEGFSNSILELMNRGLPFVATNVGGTPELIEHLRNGLLYEMADVKRLAAELIKLVSNEKLRRELSSAAMISAGQFTAGRMCAMHINEYSS